MEINKVEVILEKVKKELSLSSFILGIVLGGSRASGTANGNSDIDIGIYYDKDVDYNQLNLIAKKLDDNNRENLICHEGEWGEWGNFGGWLQIDGYQVDLIFRDIKRVENVIRKTDRGEIKLYYHMGHPHSYIDLMYRGELAESKILYSREKYFENLKEQAQIYNENLQKEIIRYFSFDIEFSTMLIEKLRNKKDTYYLMGNIFRIFSSMNQIIFALNKKWCLNEKKAVLRIENFLIKPQDYSKKIDKIVKNLVDNPVIVLEDIKKLYDEIKILIDKARV